MTSSEPAGTASRSTRGTRWALLAAVVVVTAAVVGVLDYHPSAASSGVETSRIADAPLAPTPGSPPGEGAVGEADGVVPPGVTVFENTWPAVTKLNPALLGALRRAARDAVGDGIVLYVNSGWRSPRYQEVLLRQAIAKYGSAKQAARWVATPDTSAHVSGDAVDIGHAGAAAWLSGHGARYGLCQIYRNESWHYELRVAAPERGCPPMYSDPTQDPRMQQ